MRLYLFLSSLALINTSIAARWNRRQASNQDTCTCPSNAPRTTTYVSYTLLTSSVTVPSFAGFVTETIPAITSTVIADAPITITFDAGTETVFIAGNTVTTDSPITFTTTITVSTVTTCSLTAYKHKRQASSSSTTTSLDSGAGSRGSPVITFATDFTSAGIVRHATCTCTPRATTNLSGASNCNCPASTTVVVNSVSVETLTNFVIVTFATYVTVTSTPLSAETFFSSETVTVTESDLVRITRDFTQTIQPVSTVTETTIATVNNCPTPSSSCNNQGIRWAAYNNTNAAGQNNRNTNPGVRNDNTYETFDPTVFKNRQPVYSSTANTLGGFTDPSTTSHPLRVYNSTVYLESDYLAIDHIGYLFAQLSGTYQFSVSQADDIAILWVGQNAVSGWTRDNANLIDYYEKANAVYSINLFAGNYYPFRIFYANGQGGLQFTASVTAPDGTIILNSNSGPSPYLVQFSCDGVAAPPFPAFGSET